MSSPTWRRRREDRSPSSTHREIMAVSLTGRIECVATAHFLFTASAVANSRSDRKDSMLVSTSWYNAQYDGLAVADAEDEEAAAAVGAADRRGGVDMLREETQQWR